jgi:ABC-2 type transport system ATP-binding protein
MSSQDSQTLEVAVGASNFVGRVGGLAVALGVGAAMFSGSATAWADRGGDTGASAGDDSGSSSSAGARPHRGPTAAAPHAAATVARGDSAPAATSFAPIAVPDVQSKAARPAAATEPIAIAPPAVSPASSQAAPEPEPVDVPPVTQAVTDDVTEPDPVAVSLVIEPTTEPVIKPILIIDPVEPFAPEPVDPGDITAVVYATGDDGSDGAGTDPSGPVDSALADLILASFVRRETMAAASATDSPSALVTSSATGGAGLTLAPVTTYFDGILQGNLNVTSASGCGTLGSDCTLTYSFAGSSNGGKVVLGKVPTSLPGGGAGSYTFLPFATWIDPSNPTKFPTPTGTQDFTVRVSENTKFDQFLTAIPLIGQLNAQIISLLQDTPFIGDLLAPLIGAAVKQTIAVNVGQLAAGKQVAYTYKVSSFDGTLISTNFFPASAPSLLPLLGNQQATIFNGPGLGGAGAIDPYASSGAAGSVPGLSLMRGQGLPGQLADAPLGFNVVTWDPRGEWDSGGVLQLDNPFYEGRDVSALIDWANANTPLLNENGKPDIAMMGGSYGGIIQMTTVDPRIKSIVPSIAANSLNNSLYPNGIFKSGWANNLAAALLLSGASSIDRINSQVTEALITGNFLGFISEAAQAVLSSSGPTALLTKLNIPTMYVQGTHDALFPLQQALDNARTQLEQNPFFAGANADLVKMIWFCGGHGFCSTQSLESQAAQARVIFLENMVWVNKYTKGYLAGIPAVIDQINGLLSVTAPFQWWDQKGTALASFAGMPWTTAFQNSAPVTINQATGGRINSLTSTTGPLTASDPAGAGCKVAASLCEWPLSQVFATKAKNAVNVDIPVSSSQGYIVGAPTVSFTYSGFGNAKAVYAQIVDNATGQVLGNINTPIPVTLDGREHTVTAFPIANIAYTPPSTPGATLTLQIVANSSLYENPFWSIGVDINKISVSLPTTKTAIPNPIPGLLPA